MKKLQHKTVGELIIELQRYPVDCIFHAYEGESCGIVIEEKNPKYDGKNEFHKNVGFIEDGNDV